MARPRKKLDHARIIELRGEGKGMKEISAEIGVSTATLSRRLASLRNENGIGTKYRELKGIQLTKFQEKVFARITPDKFQSASFLELAKAFAVLLKVELAMKSKGQRPFKGLARFLIDLENG